MDPSGKLKDRMSWKGYRSGHMMYLRKQDLETANDDIRAFIKTLQKTGNQQSIKIQFFQKKKKTNQRLFVCLFLLK
jgi:hypothetical protein